MSEQCPIRQERILSSDSLVDAGIPQRCLGCLALVESGEIASKIDVNDRYEAAKAEMLAVDADFDDLVAEGWASTRFDVPDATAYRSVLIENGFDDAGGDPFGAVYTETTVEFDCPVERP